MGLIQKSFIWETVLSCCGKWKARSVDMIFADPPYFLSNNGITCQGGRMVSVNKASWDEGGDFKENHAFNRRWIRMCRRVLKPGGTIWISGTLHNIYSIGMALQQERYKIINNITLKKTNPPPNLACRCFTHSTETILWARKDEKKARHLFNYEQMKQMNGGKQMKDVWEGSLTRPSEKWAGRHPTQKPGIYWNGLFWRPQKEDVVLWIILRFRNNRNCGVGKYGRQFIGIDNNEEYLDIAKRRLDQIQEALEW